MIVSDEGQAKVFFINILFGMLCILLFDIFRIPMKRWGKTKSAVILLDGLYILSVFSLILFSMVRYNLGALRYYQVFALGAGMLLYKAILSDFLQKVIEKSVKLGNKFLIALLKMLWKPVSLFLRCVFSVGAFVETKLVQLASKMKKKAKKVKLKKQKKKKTVKKRLKMI